MECSWKTLLLTAMLVLGLILYIGIYYAIKEDSAHDKCNGLEELCDKSVNDAIFMTSYASHANPDDKVMPFAQDTGLAEQLVNGVRAINIEVWPCTQSTDAACVCLDSCALGEQKLSVREAARPLPP